MPQALAKKFESIKHSGYLDKPVFLVVRTGTFTSHDPIAELDECLRKSKATWFAKFGSPIAPSAAKRLFAYREVYLVVVAQKRNKKGFGVYKLLAISGKGPTPGELFPEYYLESFARLGSWLRIEKTSLKLNGIRDLKVISSLRPLAQVIGISQRSHFICALS